MSKLHSVNHCFRNVLVNSKELWKYPNYCLIVFLKFHELKLETVNDIDIPDCKVNGGCKEEINKYQNRTYDKVLVWDGIPGKEKKRKEKNSSGICLTEF